MQLIDWALLYSQRLLNARFKIYFNWSLKIQQNFLYIWWATHQSNVELLRVLSKINENRRHQFGVQLATHELAKTGKASRRLVKNQATCDIFQRWCKKFQNFPYMTKAQNIPQRSSGCLESLILVNSSGRFDGDFALVLNTDCFATHIRLVKYI